MNQKLNTKHLIKSAKEFCATQSKVYRTELYGITDGKAVGTFVEHLFKDFLAQRYDLTIGNSASGLDLPSINTDIKVTSIKQPQSSCPYKDSKQKIYGLGYNLIIFVYRKEDDDIQRKGMLDFLSCTFVDSKRTADYQTTTGLRNIINNKVPADDVTLYNMAEDILKRPPEIGYLTISNALQWRLQYGRIVSLNENIPGITRII